MCGKGSSGGGGYGGFGNLAPMQQNTVQASPEAIGWYQQAMGKAQQAAAQPWQAYSQDPNAFVAPLTQTQQAGIQGIAGAQGTYQPYYGAAGLMTAGAGATTTPQVLGQYMNPYMQQVTQPVQAALQQQQGQQLAQQQAEAIKAGAFGGERAGLQRQALRGQQQLKMGEALSPLYAQAYQSGLGAAQTDLARQLQAGQTLGQLGTGAQTAALQAPQALLGAGTLEQQTQQAGLQALYNQFQQQRAFPYQQAQFLAGIAGGLGPLLGQQTFQSQAQSPFGMFLSDPRVKSGIREMADGGEVLGTDGPEPIGQTYDGQDIWRYSKFGQPEFGLMAPQVAERYPDAVGQYAGYQTIDPAAATDNAAAIGRGLGSSRMGGAVTGAGDYARGGYAMGGDADLGAILAAHEAMYGGLGSSKADLPTGAIQAAGPLTPASFGDVEKPPTAAEQMEKALSVGEKLTSLGKKAFDAYDYFTGKDKKKTTTPSSSSSGSSSSLFADGGEVEDDDVPTEAIPGSVTQGIKPSSGLKAAEFASNQEREREKSRGFLDTAADTLGSAGKIAGGLSGLYSAATTLGPALMAMSDPRLKSGIRQGYADRGAVEENDDVFERGLLGAESNRRQFDPQGRVVTSPKGALGIAQIMPDTAPEAAKLAGLEYNADRLRNDADYNKALGKAYYNEQLRQFGTPELALAAYNAGPGRVRQALKRADQTGADVMDLLPAETRAYVPRAMGLAGGNVDDVISQAKKLDRGYMAKAKLPDEGTTVDLNKVSEEPDEEGFGLNRQTVIPALSGLGSFLTAMTGSPSRYLGTAIAQGLGAGLTSGAKSYMEVGKQIPEIAKLQKEVGKTEAETKEREALAGRADAETREKLAGLYEKKWVPNVGWMVNRKDVPYQVPTPISDAEGKPLPGKANPDDIPTASGGDRPAVDVSKKPTEERAAVPVAAALEWKATTEAPAGVKIPGAMNIYMTEGATQKELDSAKTFVDAQRAKSSAAYDQKYRLDEMDTQFKNLEPGSFLQAGPYSSLRTNVAKVANELSSMLGGKPLFDPNNVAAAENLAKDTTRLGFDTSKALGHEPGFIVQSAVSANPGMENTALAYHRIAAGLKEAAQYEQDKLDFLESYVAKYSTIKGAEQLFRKLNPPEAYAKRAILSTIEPGDLAHLRASKKEDIMKHSAEIDKRYGKGITEMLLGEK
jgi:GH24 family phage-related lysozyme (muramidase)